MNDIKISFCMSAIRPHLWENLLNSLKDNELKYEVIFVGNVRPEFDISKYPEMKYIYATVKPAQCYECSFREAKGELISWGADDATYPPHALDDMYKFYKYFNDNRIVAAFRTVEDGKDITNVHRFRGRDMNAPIMAPFGVVDREMFIKLGGYDRRFICGQSENDVVMRFYEIGGRVEISSIPVYVNHQEAHNASGTLFRSGYYKFDRSVLENCWIKNNIIQNQRIDKVESFTDENIVTITQSNKGQWI